MVMSTAMSSEGDAVKVEGGHVSVTTISMSGPETSNGQFSYSSSGVRISVSSVPHDEDSTDAEISKIDFTQHQYEVNMRNKKKRSLSDENSSSLDLQSSRDSIDTLRNVSIKTEPVKTEGFQGLDEQRVLDLKYPSAPLQPHQRSLSMNRVNGPGSYSSRGESSNSQVTPDIPPLLQEIMDVEHLWQYNESELSRLGKSTGGSPSANPLLAASGITAHNSSPDFLADLCNIADHRLYKIVKWLGLTPCIERMLSFTDHLRRLRVDRYEYVALKVIVLLTSDAPDLREVEKVRASQEKALAALQAYIATHSPGTPAKFGELLLRIPELQRTCQFFMQVGKEMLNPANKSKDGDGPSFNLLMELLRGDH
ncbi:hypothetical protein HF086_010532 [Spodoptera exigua]|uniref:NR LBD domain-containing protein n=1 Tax=Spodoptera exigua TaxID=7107 RepID=A0A922MUV2_SPOEX|nr:hypothetical protein HF086_010532 [Spodoptera exigua]